MLRLLPFGLLMACGPLATLEDQRAIWEAQGLDDYSYVLRRGCFCPEEYTLPVEITVVGDAVSSAVYAEDSALAGEPVVDDYETLTIDELFDFTAEAIAEADRIEIEYDATAGYPSSVQIDYQVMAADDELSVHASDLRAD
jgi:hypothetical protein